MKMFGRYACFLPNPFARGELRPLRDLRADDGELDETILNQPFRSVAPQTPPQRERGPNLRYGPSEFGHA